MLKRSTSIVPWLALAFAGCAQVAPTPPHPVVGKWRWISDATQCSEIYDFRDNRTLAIQSGLERSDAKYTISAAPNQAGFYSLNVTVTHDYGGVGCGGDDGDSSGDSSDLFLAFHTSRREMIICREQNLDRCFGPLSPVP